MNKRLRLGLVEVEKGQRHSAAILKQSCKGGGGVPDLQSGRRCGLQGCHRPCIHKPGIHVPDRHPRREPSQGDECCSGPPPERELVNNYRNYK